MKKIGFVLLVISLIVLLMGCNTEEMSSSVKIKYDVSGEELKGAIYVGKMCGECLYTFQDPKTGVWYYFGNSTGITPRFYRDGSPYTGD